MYKELLQARRRNSVPRCEVKATPQREVKSSSPKVYYFSTSQPESRSIKLPNSLNYKVPESSNERDATTSRRTKREVQTLRIGTQEVTTLRRKTQRKVNSAPTRGETLLHQVNATSRHKDVTPPTSNRSTPKKASDGLNFLVTGKQILGSCERANSLPGSSLLLSGSPKSHAKCRSTSLSSKSGHSSLADDISLDMSQASDDEEAISRCSQINNLTFTTSTPKGIRNTPKNFAQLRRASLQLNYSPKEVSRRAENLIEDGRDDFFSCSRDDSLYKTISALSDIRSNCDSSSDLAYSSTSSEYSGRSSAATPGSTPGLITGSSTCLSYQACSKSQEVNHPPTKAYEGEITVDGEWHNFWVKYSSSLAAGAVDKNYDQCPTPFARDLHRDTLDRDFSTASTKPVSGGNCEHNLNLDGLSLTNSETRNVFKCAQILGNVLTTAIERKTKNNQEKTTNNKEIKTQNYEEDKIENEYERKVKKEETKYKQNSDIMKEREPLKIKKESLTLDLKGTALPVNEKVRMRREAVTQTDS